MTKELQIMDGQIPSRELSWGKPPVARRPIGSLRLMHTLCKMIRCVVLFNIE